MVCPNTVVSKLVYDWIAGTQTEVEHGPPIGKSGRLDLFNNIEDGATLARPRTILVDSAQLESGEAYARTWKTLKVRPDGKSKHPERTLTHYCVYVDAINQHVYTPTYVQKLVELLSTEEGYKATVGTAPNRKVTKLPTAKKGTPAVGASS